MLLKPSSRSKRLGANFKYNPIYLPHLMPDGPSLLADSAGDIPKAILNV